MKIQEIVIVIILLLIDSNYYFIFIDIPIMSAVMKKIACNATNSAAIDSSGNLFVWGSTRYGLCGDQDALGTASKATDGALSSYQDGKGAPSKNACITEPR